MTDLEAFLDYYASLKEPGYAVLVTGAWGAGKTFQVLQALSKDEYYYVSLNGISSPQDVHDAVLAAALPTAKGITKATEWIGSAGKAIGGFAKLAEIAPDVANAMLRKRMKFDRIIVFDDLERCQLPIAESLGLINNYVEHQKCRVVLIAHDQKIEAELRDRKEKLVGQTFEIEAQTEEALEAFIDDLDDAEARRFINEYNPTLLGVFSQSGVKSLRTLRQSIRDLARLYDVLHRDHRACDELLAGLVPFFFALDIEYREGHVLRSDLENRINAQHAYYLKKASKTGNESDLPKPSILGRNEKYADVDLTSNLLSDDMVMEMIVRGRYRPEPLKAALDKHPLFASYDELPPWKIVWYFFQVPDDIVNQAAQRMENQFLDREITVPGEILHICCLRIMMAEEGILDKPVDCIVTENIQYISDVLERGDLQPRPTNWDWKHDFFMQHDNLGFWGDRDGKPEIRKIKEHLAACMEQALENSFENRISDLLDLLRNDTTEFRREISYNDFRESPFAAIPVLKAIPPVDFVDAWLSAHERDWHSISRALERRYEGAKSDGDLKSEWAWLHEVFQLLHKIASASTGFRRVRINNVIPDNLENRVKKELKLVDQPDQ